MLCPSMSTALVIFDRTTLSRRRFMSRFGMRMSVRSRLRPVMFDACDLRIAVMPKAHPVPWLRRELRPALFREIQLAHPGQLILGIPLGNRAEPHGFNPRRPPDHAAIFLAGQSRRTRRRYRHHQKDTRAPRNVPHCRKSHTGRPSAPHRSTAGIASS